VQCFDFDWKCSKIEKIVKNPKEKEKIYNYLCKNYKTVYAFLLKPYNDDIVVKRISTMQV
jgi:hypothetical protein